MGMKYKDPTTGNFKEINVKVADTLPVGSEVDYNGTTIPTGWEEVDSPNDYSTEETRIGTFMGKPLYRKVFTLSNQASTSSNTDYIDISGLGINELTLFRGILKSSTGGRYIIPFTDSSSNYNVFFVTQTHIRGRFQLGDGGTSANLLFILEYTKTTD